MMSGGIANAVTGMGGPGDTSQHSYFSPTSYLGKEVLETIYNQSWVAAKFIDIMVDDMLYRWRAWEGDMGEDAAEKLQEAERRHKVKHHLAAAMKAGALFGSSLLYMVTREAAPHTPLDPKRIREGDLKGFIVFNRYSAYPTKWGRKLDEPATYNMPVEYGLVSRYGEDRRVHHSRVLRFDGIKPLTSERWSQYVDYDWGISTLVRAMLTISQDATIRTAAAHLANVASIPVMSVEGLREVLSGQVREGVEMSPEQIGRQINEMMSVWRLLMIDKSDETFTRVAVNFAGFADIMDRVERTLASMAGIPLTRWASMSPGGLNATGDHDAQNYAMVVDSNRDQRLDPVIDLLDEVLARDAGLQDVPDYEWRSLYEASEKDLVEVSGAKVTTLSAALKDGVIDEDEYRERLDGDHVFGVLAGPAPEPDPALLMPGMPGGPPMPPVPGQPPLPAPPAPPAPPRKPPAAAGNAS